MMLHAHPTDGQALGAGTLAVDSLGSRAHQTGPAEWQSRIAQYLPSTAILQ